MTASTSNVFCSPLSSEIFHLVFLVLFVLSQSSHIFEQDSATEIVNYVTDITITHTGIWSKVGCGAFCLIDTNFSSCAVFGLDANFERCTCGRMYFVPPVTSGQVSNNLTFYVNAACKDETEAIWSSWTDWFCDRVNKTLIRQKTCPSAPVNLASQTCPPGHQQTEVDQPCVAFHSSSPSFDNLLSYSDASVVLRDECEVFVSNDPVQTNYWVADSTPPGHLVFELPFLASITEIRLRNTNSAQWQNAGTDQFSIHLSDNPSTNWTLILTDNLIDIVGMDCSQIPTQPFPVNQCASYVKIVLETCFRMTCGLSYVDIVYEVSCPI